MKTKKIKEGPREKLLRNGAKAASILAVIEFVRRRIRPEGTKNNFSN